MKGKFIENGIEYVRNGDYYIPNLTVLMTRFTTLGSMADCTQYLLKKIARQFTQ